MKLWLDVLSNNKEIIQVFKNICLHKKNYYKRKSWPFKKKKIIFFIFQNICSAAPTCRLGQDLLNSLVNAENKDAEDFGVEYGFGLVGDVPSILDKHNLTAKVKCPICTIYKIVRGVFFLFFFSIQKREKSRCEDSHDFLLLLFLLQELCNTEMT